MKVSIYTQAYNTPEPDMRQCIESVLNQTFTDFEYVIVDNGCTDGTTDILREYASKDCRIVLIHREENSLYVPWVHIAQKREGGEYLMNLDSDDWIEPDFLERLVRVADETRADITCTGVFRDTVTADGGYANVDIMKFDKCTYFDKSQFANKWPEYFWFLRMLWNKLFRAETFRKAEIPDFMKLGVTFGSDTDTVFSVLKHANALVIDNSVLQHYRMRSTSVTGKYDPQRLFSYIFRYNYIKSFLEEYGSLSERNQTVLYMSMAGGINGYLGTIAHSTMMPQERLMKYREVCDIPLMKKIYTVNIPSIQENRLNFVAWTLECCLSAPKESNDDFRAVIATLLPNCGTVISLETAGLILENQSAINALCGDNREDLIVALLEMVKANRSSVLNRNRNAPRHKKRRRTQQQASPNQKSSHGNQALCTLVYELSKQDEFFEDDPILKSACTESFLQEYGDLYVLLRKKQYLEALDAMTGILLHGGGKNSNFLNLYLSLAAIEEEVSAFVFGKVQMARYYLAQDAQSDCLAILEELTQMGVEENLEIRAIRRELQNKSRKGSS